jgi:hypothetical protein
MEGLTALVAIPQCTLLVDRVMTYQALLGSFG